MPWHYINCGDPTLADPLVEDVLTQFRCMQSDAQLPAGAAIYSRHESRGGLHCELILYFTPEAAPAATAMDATPCAAPEAQGLSPASG